MSKYITYEQPLNERIRTFLRLEHLFEIFDTRRQGITIQDTRDSITILIDISEVLSRFDVKSEIIKELEIHSNHLKRLINNPNVDQQQLSPILDDIEKQSHTLHNPDFQPGKFFNNHELINSVKQRSVITGGGCNFDLPNYFYWLNNTLDDRRLLVEQLYKDLAIVDNSIRLCLHITRNSSNTVDITAQKGFYQQSLDTNSPCQMLRIILNQQDKYFPEVSAGKHRFSIRFMQLINPEERATQINQDINFKLSCCD